MSIAGRAVVICPGDQGQGRHRQRRRGANHRRSGGPAGGPQGELRGLDDAAGGCRRYAVPVLRRSRGRQRSTHTPVWQGVVKW